MQHIFFSLNVKGKRHMLLKPPAVTVLWRRWAIEVHISVRQAMGWVIHIQYQWVFAFSCQIVKVCWSPLMPIRIVAIELMGIGRTYDWRHQVVTHKAKAFSHSGSLSSLPLWLSLWICCYHSLSASVFLLCLSLVACLSVSLLFDLPNKNSLSPCFFL